MFDNVVDFVITYLPDALMVVGALTSIALVVAKLTKNTLDDTVARALVWVRDRLGYVGTLQFLRRRSGRTTSALSKLGKASPKRVRDQRK